MAALPWFFPFAQIATIPILPVYPNLSIQERSQHAPSYFFLDFKKRNDILPQLNSTFISEGEPS